MPDAKSILADLKKKGSEKTRKIYARHGMPEHRTFGVSMADLKTVAKSVRGQQALAHELYKSGVMDAMYLAGMVANGAQLSAEDLDAWVEAAAGLQMVSEYTVPWLAVENENGRELALKWMKSNKEHVAAAGWCTYAGIVATKADSELDLKEIEELLVTVVRDIAKARNRVRYTMNQFVISVGGYVKPLSNKAKAAAEKIGDVSVDLGDTSCQVPRASEYIAKMEARGKLGQKRKTMRC